MKKYYQPFTSYIYHTDESRVSNHSELKDYCLNKYNSIEKKDNFYGTGFTSFYIRDNVSSHLNTEPLFKELCSKILHDAENYVNHHIPHFMEHWSPSPRWRPLKFSNLWFNVNPPGAYQARHHHANNLLGGTYYLQIPPNSGQIVFSTPNQFGYLNAQNEPRDKLLITHIAMPVEEGDMLIWPGWMDHEITANKTVDSTRITISFALDWMEI